MRLSRPSILALLVFVKLAVLVAGAALMGGQATLCQFDCQWYQHIAANGYDESPRLMGDSDATNYPFYPLYPMLIRLGTTFGASPLASGLLVAAVALFVFLLVGNRYRAITRPGRDPERFVLALLVFPFGLYLSLPYTEAVYAAVTVSLLWAYRRQAWASMGALSGLLTAIRPTGILVVPYLVVVTLWRGRSLLGPGVARRWGALADLLFPLALMPLGLALMMAYMAWLTGDALASTHALAPWGRGFGNPLRVFYWNVNVGDWSLLLSEAGPESRAFSALCAVPAALGCAWLLLRRLPFEAWILGITTFVALAAGTESLPRYVSANPVFLLLVGDVADRIGSRTVRWVLGALCLVLQGVLLHRWLLGSRMMM